MKEQVSKPPVKELSELAPKVRRELEKHADAAKRFSDKFVKARILDESTLHRHVTI